MARVIAATASAGFTLQAANFIEVARGDVRDCEDFFTYYISATSQTPSSTLGGILLYRIAVVSPFGQLSIAAYGALPVGMFMVSDNFTAQCSKIILSLTYSDVQSGTTLGPSIVKAQVLGSAL